MSYPERIVPEETEPGIVALHLKRYEFARPRCAGKDVLDAACGVGYGSAFLAEEARHVLGVDRSEEAIAYARGHYARPNVDFAVMDLLSLGIEGGSVDVACSFETIEHVPDPERALGELARTLRDDGVLIVSTPQAERTTREPDNPFHHVEYSRADFEALLRRFFEEVALYGQRRLQTRRHRFLQRLDVLGLRKRFAVLRRASVLVGTPPTEALTLDDVVIAREGIERATELVAVCARPHRTP